MRITLTVPTACRNQRSTHSDESRGRVRSSCSYGAAEAAEAAFGHLTSAADCLQPIALT